MFIWENWCFSLIPKAEKTQYPAHRHTGRGGKSSLPSLLVLVRPSPGWVRPTHPGKGIVICSPEGQMFLFWILFG